VSVVTFSDLVGVQKTVSKFVNWERRREFKTDPIWYQFYWRWDALQASRKIAKIQHPSWTV